MNKNSTSNNLTLTEKGYEEIAYTFTESDSNCKSSYSNSSVNFFGASSGLIYTNLDINSFKDC